MLPLSKPPDSKSAATSRDRWPWFVLKLLLALGFLGVVLSKVRLEEAWRVWHEASWGWLPFYVSIFLGTVLMVARRYQILLKGEVPFGQVLSVVLLQTSMGNLVFNIAGFATYVALMRGKYQVGVGRGVGTLVVARFLDLVVWLPVLAVATWRVWPQVAEVIWLPLTVLGGLSLLVLVVSQVVIYRSQFLDLISQVLDFFGLRRLSWIERSLVTLTALAEEEPKFWKTEALSLLIWSALITVGSALVFYSNLRVFGLSLPPATVIFIWALQMLTMLLPIVVLGGLGVTDLTGLYLFSLFGLGPYTVAPVIIGGRLLFYGVSFLLYMLYLCLSCRLAPGKAELRG